MNAPPLIGGECGGRSQAHSSSLSSEPSFDVMPEAEAQNTGDRWIGRRQPLLYLQLFSREISELVSELVSRKLTPATTMAPPSPTWASRGYLEFPVLPL